MIKKSSLLILILLINLFSNASHIQNQLLVMLDKKADANEFIQNFQNFTYPANFHLVSVISNELNIILIECEPNYYAANYLDLVHKVESVQLAQLNHNDISIRSNFPNDPSYLQQWNMDIINAPEAWDISTSGKTKLGDSIVIAVIDVGFDLEHSDLNYWVNNLEIPNDSIDNDSNGFVDDYYGWNAYNSTGSFSEDNHGTHVAGIIAAKGNNNLGVTGINWNAKIMPVMGGSSLESVVVEAYSYVYTQRKLYNLSKGDSGAYVVATNSSFGVDFGQASQYPIWCAMYDSLGNIGVLNVSATSNINYNVDSLGDVPSSCPSEHLVVVTSTNRSDLFSGNGYGLKDIDIAAPGAGVFSTTVNSNYNFESGTSMACPHVAGTIGLIYSSFTDTLLNHYKNHQDSLSLAASFILNNYSSNKLVSLENKCKTEGRLDLYKSLKNTQDFHLKAFQGKEDVATFIENRNNDIDFQIYPNPTNSNNISVIVTSKLKIQIISSYGQVIITHSLNSGNNSIDVSRLSKGLYFIVCSSEHNLKFTKHFVKY